MFQFYGANRTGRWAGRLIQMQNLPQNHLPDLEQARALVRCGDYEALELLYEDVPDTLSQLIRTAFVPRAGAKFIVSDFSAIEARVIAWFASEQWRQDVFAKGGDIYCASASQMFKVPVEKHGINGHLRQKGKIAELALGYGGSVGALKAMGALEMGLTEDELPPLVDAWRQSNPNIVKLWWDVDRAALEAVRNKHTNSTHDYVCAEYKNHYRNGENFISADCLPVDCDNDHSEDPKDWVTPADVLEAFPGVSIAIHYSRFNNREKNGKPARPKFHVLFPIDRMTDATLYSDMKKLVNSIFPYFDTKALDAARFFFGTQEPNVELYPGRMVIIDELSSFKNHKAKRFKSLMKVRPYIHRIIGLTGTPSSNGLMDLWAEFKLLDKGQRLGRFITQYRINYFIPDKRNGEIIYSYKPLPYAEDAIYRRISDITISMDGKSANLILTDPPYGVSFKASDGLTIENDSLKGEEFYNFLLAAFKNMWSEGTIGIPDAADKNKYTACHYWVKHYDEPSEIYGLNKGRISKLMGLPSGCIICSALP